MSTHRRARGDVGAGRLDGFGQVGPRALLSRLYDVTEGVIRVDGHDIRELSLPALREAVATAFEDPTLFSMSVAETCGWAAGRDGRAAGAGHRRRRAQFVYDLPFGLDTASASRG